MNRPNILILLSDQLRRQALGCYGDPDARTPNMDGLARDGVRFTTANATCPVCVPFRFTLMTGEYAHSRLAPAIEWAMSPAERTLADEFNERDYETVYIGKWHLDGGHGRMGSAKQCGMTPVRRSHRGRWCKWLGFELRNDLERDPFECENLIDHPAAKTEIVRHHGLLAKRLREADDPFVLLPAFGHEGVNLWEVT